MENFTPNGYARNQRLQFRIRNGGCQDRNGGSALAGGSSPQMRCSLSKENVRKSRSNEWYMLSPSRAERNNNYYCTDVHFPKSVTSGLLTPDVFSYAPYYENRALRGPIISSGRWPNSIEDPERETTRSSSNPPISSSTSEAELADQSFGRKADDCSLCTPLMNEKEKDLTNGAVTEKESYPRDSLPRHRERLSQRRKCGRRVSSTTDTTQLHKSEKAGSYTPTSDLTSGHHDAVDQTFLQKIYPGRMNPNYSQVRKKRDAYLANSKRPHDLKLCSQDHNANSLADVGSWLANQSFDWIDSSYSPLPSMNGSANWQGSQNEFTRRPDEIMFTTPTPRDVTFNVSGQFYRIDPNVLARFPDTLLGNPDKRAKYWDPLRNEYFLDRHRATFEVVIEYYFKNGELHRPDDIPIDIFIHEIKFYCLDRQKLHDFLSAEGILLVVKEKPAPNTPAKKFIWNLFEDPESGWTARFVTTMSAMVIAISVVVFCMETVPAFKSLGESSLENIGPALNRCEQVLGARPGLFYPVGFLFAGVGDELRPCNKSAPGQDDDIPGGHRREGGGVRGRRSTDIDDGERESFLQNSLIDDFSSQIVISTMRETLSLCAAEETMKVLTKYTLLRCDVEMDDAFAYTGTPIKHILSEVEVHECPHEHKEDKDHHAETGNEHHDDHGEIDNRVSKEKTEREKPELHGRVHDKPILNLNLPSTESNDGPVQHSVIKNGGDGRHREEGGANEGKAKKEPGILHFARKVSTAVTKSHPLLSTNLPKSERKSKRKSRKSKKKTQVSDDKKKFFTTKSPNKKVRSEAKDNNSRRKSKRKRPKLRKESERVKKTKKDNSTIKKSKRVRIRNREKRSVQEEWDVSNSNHSVPENSTIRDNSSELLTLRQTIIALNQVCSELDKHSYRSSYNWFVLEASLGGTAGQLFLIESGCIVWFVIEIILRFYSCPGKIKFCTNFLNIIDAIAILPYFITLIVTSLQTDSNLRPQTATILRTIRLVRMLRILKLSRHSRGLRILGLTLLRSTRVLVLLVCFQMVLAVTFSSIVYYVEYDAKDTQFKSIPGSFWWAIITMTTVGYGDVVPITTWGRITGAFCAIMGILGIAFPVPVIVSNFNYLYNLDSDDCKLTAEELMGERDENERNTVVERFQENLFDAVRRNVGSMSGGPQESQPTGQNPAELWNYTRRQYHGSEKKTQKPPEPGRSNKFTKGLVALATASALTVSLPDSTSVKTRPDAMRRRKATSI